MGDFSYKNLISKYFSSRGELKSRGVRIRTCVQFVTDKVPGKCARSELAIEKAVVSVDATFMKKYREAKCVMDRFEKENENWLRTDLEVR